MFLGSMRESFRGNLSPALPARGESEKKAQRIGQHKHIGGPYEILGKKPPGEEFYRGQPGLRGA
jgi:hypothetical protein